MELKHIRRIENNLKEQNRVWSLKQITITKSTITLNNDNNYRQIETYFYGYAFYRECDNHTLGTESHHQVSRCSLVHNLDHISKTGKNFKHNSKTPQKTNNNSSKVNKHPIIVNLHTAADIANWFRLRIHCTFNRKEKSSRELETRKQFPQIRVYSSTTMAVDWLHNI